MRAPDGTLDGLEIRVGKEIAKRLGLEYTPVIIKWELLLVGLAADQYDFASDAMDITEERQKAVTFADGWLEFGRPGGDQEGLRHQEVGRHQGTRPSACWSPRPGRSSPKSAAPT